MESDVARAEGAESLLNIDVMRQGKLLEKLEAELRLLHVEIGELTSMKQGRGMYVRSGPHVMFQVKDKQKLIAQKQEELKHKQAARDRARSQLEDLQRRLNELLRRRQAGGLIQ